MADDLGAYGPSESVETSGVRVPPRTGPHPSHLPHCVWSRPYREPCAVREQCPADREQGRMTFAEGGRGREVGTSVRVRCGTRREDGVGGRGHTRIRSHPSPVHEGRTSRNPGGNGRPNSRLEVRCFGDTRWGRGEGGRDDVGVSLRTVGNLHRGRRHGAGAGREEGGRTPTYPGSSPTD